MMEITDQKIDTGDSVLHGPTGETWLVAYVHGHDLCCCGWPASLAKLKDCTLTEKATPEARLQLLKDLADISGNDSRLDGGLKAGSHCDACWDKMVSSCRSRIW